MMWTNRLDELLKRGYILMYNRPMYSLIGAHGRFDGNDLLLLIDRAWNEQ